MWAPAGTCGGRARSTWGAVASAWVLARLAHEHGVASAAASPLIPRGVHYSSCHWQGTSLPFPRVRGPGRQDRGLRPFRVGRGRLAAVHHIVMNVAVPQEVIAGQDSSPMVPAEAPSTQTVRAMDEAFGNDGANSSSSRWSARQGLTKVDQICQSLVGELRRQGTTSSSSRHPRPELRKALTSKDGRAVPAGRDHHATGARPDASGSPPSARSFAPERALTGFTVQVTGPTATVGRPDDRDGAQRRTDHRRHDRADRAHPVPDLPRGGGPR